MTSLFEEEFALLLCKHTVKAKREERAKHFRQLRNQLNSMLLSDLTEPLQEVASDPPTDGAEK